MKSYRLSVKTTRNFKFHIALFRIHSRPIDCRGKEEIGKVKEATSDMKLCRNSPKEILDVSE